MNMYLFLSLFSGLSIIYLVLGYITSRNIKTSKDYFLANRQLGLWSIAATLVATQVGGGFLLGTAAEAYKTGYYGMFYTLGMSLGFLLLGFGFAAKLREYNIATIPELFTLRYDSPALRKIASVLCVISLAGITAGQFVSSRAVMKALGVQSEALFLFFCAIVITYPVMGGLKAIRTNDMLQLLLIAVSFAGVFVYSLSGEPSSFFTFSNLINQQTFFNSGAISFTGYFLMPALFSLIEQDLAQQFFAAKNRSIAVSAAFTAALCLIALTFIPVYFGMKAKFLGLAVPAGANPLIVLLESMTNEAVMAVIVCALLAAIISTIVSLLCAVGSLLAQDFEISFATEKKQLLFSQATVLGTGIFAVVVAYFFDNILAVLTQSYELPVSCLFIPLFICFFTQGRLSKKAAIGAIVGGMIGFFVFRFWSIGVPREVASLVLSGCGYLMGLLYPVRPE